MQRSRAVAGGLFAGYLAPWCLLGLSSPHGLRAQEKKNLRPVLVSLSWDSELPFRVAMAKGYFRRQGLTIEPLFIRGGPAAMAGLVSGAADSALPGLHPTSPRRWMASKPYSKRIFRPVSSIKK